MRVLATVIWGILIAAVLAVGYVRLAPSDPAKWHRMPAEMKHENLKRGAKRVVQTGPDGLARFDQFARVTDRTSVLEGSVGEGMVTYITRTKVFGFPDYTTAQQDGDFLKVYGRSRFGASDTGVNRARVDQWLRLVEAGG